MNSNRFFIIPRYDYLPEEMQRFAQELGEILKRQFENIYLDMAPRISILPDLDTTPSVKNLHGKILVANNSGATGITDFDDAEEGQIIYLITTNGNTTIADATNFKLSAAWGPNADDTLMLMKRSGIWHEQARSAN